MFSQNVSNLSKLECSYKPENMLQSKGTKILSELEEYFTTSEKAINTALSVYRVLGLDRISGLLPDRQQSKYKKSDLLMMLLLFPLWGIENIRGYSLSKIKDKFEAGVDTLYRLKNNPQIDWRKMLGSINRKLFQYCDDKGLNENTPRCIIIDDTDLKKRGKTIEHIGNIWSHVSNSFVLGYKALVMGYWDGKVFTGLDFSLHKEIGKNRSRPYGLTRKERNRQYSKHRDPSCSGYQREQELTMSKIDSTVSMIRRAIRKGIVFEYALMDSWFVCKKIITAVLKTKGHLLGMVKNGKTLYKYEGKALTANQIHNRLNRNGLYERSRVLKMHVGSAIAQLDDVVIQLFFYKGGRRKGFTVLLSTDTNLTPLKAYRIYSIRWSVEVFFKESRKHFNLGKSQSEDFDGQIAEITISIIQYNIFSIAKRTAAYQTLGDLFKELDNQIIEKTVAERIWGLILELLNLISDLLDIDVHELIMKLFRDEKNQAKIRKLSAIYSAIAA